jgi:predicted Fe-Mo cluster-binding NifX family protein
MRVAISTDHNEVSAHFGRCSHYTIFEVEENQITGKTLLDTPAHQPGMLPPFLNEKGVNVVISGGMGPRAQNLFSELGIEPIVGVTGNVDEVIRGYLQGKLTRGESLCDHGQAGHGDCHPG